MNRSPVPRLVLFHGLASTPKEFGFLAHPLRRQGIVMQAPEIPGYSAGMLDDKPRWQAWVDSAARRIEELNAETPGPFVLGGLCTGSILALALAEDRELPGLCGLALMSPLFSYDGWGLPSWYGLRRIAYMLGIARHFSMEERPPFGLKNERMRQWIRQQMQTGEATLVGPAKVSLQVVRESERLSRHVLPLLPGLQVPVLAQHAREDEICALASVEAALAGVPADLLSFNVLEDSYHMITADNDRHRVAEHLAAFTQSLARPAPSPRSFPVDASPATRVDRIEIAIAS